MAGNPSPLTQALARYPNLDRNAVLAVAKQEGLSGGIGDGGHAFGPWQLNDAGGVLTGKFPGQSAQQKNAWAWSPPGLDYALQGIAKVAGGLHGSQAINAIVRRFERPADPNGEVARALGGGAGGAGGMGGGLPANVPAGPGGGVQNRQALLQAILGSISKTGQLENPSALVQALQTRNQVGGMVAPPVAPGSPGSAPVPPGHGGIAELLQEGTGGPTHSTGPHVHAAFTNPQLELQAIKEAQALGLHVGENPYVGSMPAQGVHAKNSYHYRDFPGSYNGKQLGQAIDVSGDPKQSQMFYAWLAKRKGGQ